VSTVSSVPRVTNVPRVTSVPRVAAVRETPEGHRREPGAPCRKGDEVEVHDER
jgi:hypothetical protein